MAKAKFDIEQHITNQFIERLEEVDTNWEKPFFGTGGQPVNVITGKAYRGVNILFLMIQGRESSKWGTYKQWAEKGAQVRKGQKATSIVLWKPVEGKNKDTGDKETFLLVRSYAVFNADQVDGYEEPKIDLTDNTKTIEAADDFFEALDIDTRFSGEGRAYYSPSEDYVHIPNRQNFKATSTSSATDAFYSTWAHEDIHATMHKDRLDRDMGSYAAEELVAEIGSCLIMAHLGLNNTVREDHIKYVKSWLEKLKGDKKFIIKAASKAQKALDWMVEQQPEELAEAA